MTVPVSKSRDPFALVNVLVLSAVAAAALAIWVFADLGGWDYYSQLSHAATSG